MTPYFSIIIPCLNEEHFLPHLLKNLNIQSFTDFETIVVDGHSEDKTAQVTQKFPAKYPLHLYSTKVRSASYQRNLGAKKANGKILIFFDADTQIPKNYLKQIAKTFKQKHPDFLTTYMDVDSKKMSGLVFSAFNNLTFEIGKLTKRPYSFGAMQAVEKTAFFNVGGYDKKTKFGEDSQLFINLINSGYKYVLLKRPRYIFSTRRLHLEGFLKLILKYAKLNLHTLKKGYHAPSKVEYSMGGQRYQTPHKSK